MPLPDGPRKKYEATLGTSLADVRVHTGKYASTLTNEHNARAFAKGKDIYFNQGEDPADPKKEKLLAHEVAHTVQQRGANTAGPLATTTPGDSVEQEADKAATGMIDGTPVSVSAAPAAIARKTKDEEDKEEEERREVQYFDDSMFSASKFQLQKGGGLTVIDLGDIVRVQSPEVIASSNATLNLPKQLKLGSKTVKVGPIQTITSSVRTGVYQKDANAPTKQTAKIGQIRDAAAVAKKKEGGEQSQGAMTYSMQADKKKKDKDFGNQNTGPFYSGNPKIEIHKENQKKISAGAKDNELNDAGRAEKAELGQFAGDAPGPVQVVMIDQPSAIFKKELPDGSRLIGTEGADEFNTSAGFKTSTGEVFAKAPFGWRVSWNKKIDPTKEVDKDDKHDPIGRFDVPEAIVEDTDIFVTQLANINSVADANYRGPEWLIENLPKAREARPEAADFMEQALAGKSVTITVKPVKSASDDAGVTTKLGLAITPSINKLGPTTNASVMVGQATTISTTVGALAKVAGLTLDSSLHVHVSETTDGEAFLGGTVSLGLLAGGTALVTGSNEGVQGTYEVTTSIGA